jgi:ubiquinol-cytochrome c reductase iron-sulfur subunit
MSGLPPPRRPSIEGEPIPDSARPLGPDDDPTGVELPSSPRMELLVALLLAAAGLLGAGFVVAYVLTRSTQLYGITLGGALACAAAALVLVGKRVVPQEIVLEPRHPLRHEEDERRTADLLAFGTSGITRRRLLGWCTALAGAGIGAAAIAAAASFGPWIGDQSISSPWRRGTALVGENGEPILADDLEVGGFTTAFADGASTEQLGSPVIVVRLEPDSLHLPAGREDWAPEGILAYSKICTHAGCAVAMERYPLFRAHVPGPALVCPCHYSTFDVTTGATVVFGPAGRPLPQLPLEIGDDGALRASGPLSGDVGPAWFNVERG